MYLHPAPRGEAVEGLLQDRVVVVESRIHQPHEDEVERVGEYPLIMLAVLLYENAIIGGIGRLDQAEIGPDDLRFRVLSRELAGPDSCTCSNVQNLSWRSNRSFIKLAPVVELENSVLEIKPVLLGLEYHPEDEYFW